MRIIDTHTHVYSERFDADLDEVLSRAKLAGVERILMPNVDVSTIDRVNETADRYKGFCLPMMGLHPKSVGEHWKDDLATIKKQFESKSYISIGEIGLDLSHNKTFASEQISVFEEQLRWSIEYDLPVNIHSGQTMDACLSSIRKIGQEKLRGVFHSFSGTEEELQEVMALDNFYMGINGVATFKNATLSSVLRSTDLSRLIMETDAPYLAPAPHRGKRNEPSYVSLIVQKLADIYGVSPEEVAEITTRNAEKLYRL